MKLKASERIPTLALGSVSDQAKRTLDEVRELLFASCVVRT